MDPAAAVAPDRSCCLGRTCKEWLLHGVLPAATLPNLLFGVQSLYFDDCSGIPLLPYFEIIFFLVNVCKASMDMYYRLEIRKAAGEGPLDSGLQIFSGVLGLVILGLMVWGCTLTFGKNYVSHPEQCNSSVYVTGFLTTVITILAVLILGTVEVVRAIRSIRRTARQTNLLDGAQQPV